MLNKSLIELSPTQAAGIVLNIDSAWHSHPYVHVYIWDAIRLVNILMAGGASLR